MEIDRILYPIFSLGPNKRLALWTIGCQKGCYNCANPELWAKNPKKNIPVEILYHHIKQLAKNHPIEGITITGGEPLDQLDELKELLVLLNKITPDILLYTGYTLTKLTPEVVTFLKQNVAVVIDGRYIDNLNDNQAPLRGSTNQNIYYFKEEYRPIYEEYLSQGRQVQNIFYHNHLISVGISLRGK